MLVRGKKALTAIALICAVKILYVLTFTVRGPEMLRRHRSSEKLLAGTILFLAIGGGLLHCAHFGSACGFSDHNDIKHDQITQLTCCVVVLTVWFMLPFISPFYSYPGLKAVKNLQQGYLILPFRPPR